jgi:hypothetical protein
VSDKSNQLPVTKPTSGIHQTQDASKELCLGSGKIIGKRTFCNVLITNWEREGM